MADSLEEISLELRSMHLEEGDALFIKGSRSYGLESLVEEFCLS
jgi:UDP-N-acetylmuramyl pentapeptide synthase